MQQPDPRNTERFKCPHCGANNYQGTTACWQCAKPLAVVHGQVKMPSPNNASGAPIVLPPMPNHTGLATKAAVMMGLMFPWAGIIVGIVFLMLDDDRKTQLGWQTIIWSAIGTVVSVIIFIITALPFVLAFSHGGRGLLPQIPSGLPTNP